MLNARQKLLNFTCLSLNFNEKKLFLKIHFQNVDVVFYEQHHFKSIFNLFAYLLVRNKLIKY